MTNLGPQRINQSFGDLLQLPNGLTPAIQNVQDGSGNVTPLEISTTAVDLPIVGPDGSGMLSDLGGASGSNYIGFLQAGTGAITTRSAQDKMQEWVSVLDFGADPTGATDSTVKIQAAINTNKPVYVPEGIYLTGTLNFPNGLVNTPCVFQGAGIGKTILQANAANIVLIQKINTAGSIDGGFIGDFSVKPHASGSTNAAILCTGFRTSKFCRIQGLSNGASGFYALFSVSAYPWLCYRNTWEGIIMDSTQGYTYGIYFNSGGTNNPLNNSNIGAIRDCWFNSNTGMSVVVDLTRSAKVAVENCLFEANAGAVAISSGTATLIKDNWFELNGTDLDFPSVADGAGNNGLVVSNYFSTAHNVNFYNLTSGNLWLNNAEPGAQTFINNSYQNFKSQVSFASNIVNPTIPSIVYSSGQTGVLTFNSSAVTTTINQLSGDIIMEIAYTWTATVASTSTQFTLTPPTGFNFKSATCGLIRNASGEPGIIGFDSDSSFWVFNKYNDAQGIVITVVYTRS